MSRLHPPPCSTRYAANQIRRFQEDPKKMNLTRAPISTVNRSHGLVDSVGSGLVRLEVR
jgi:hypothetical protein